MRLPIRLLAVASAVTLAAVLPTAAAAATATTAVVFDCQAKPPIGSPAQLSLDTAIVATAPETVPPGGAFDAVVAADPIIVPGTAAGATVTNIRDLVLTAPVPANATVSSVTLSGGSGLGDAPPTATVADGVIKLTVPGPIAGGATFQLPALTLSLVASDAVGATIATRLSGTSYTDPGLTFIAKVKVAFLSLDVPAGCFPSPSPTFTSTVITAPSEEPPPSEEPAPGEDA